MNPLSPSKMSPARNPFSDWFDYVYTYLPTFNSTFNPTFNFGCNVDDIPAEHHVLNTPGVGSYGAQLNRVLDGLSVLLKKTSREGLSKEDKQKLEALDLLIKNADDAAKIYQGQATESGVEDFLQGMSALKDADEELYESLRKRVLDNLPEAAKAAVNES